MPKKVIEKEGLLTVSTTISRMGELVKTVTDKTDKIKIRPFVTDTATVSVKKGVTKSIANYESARVDVMLSVPCYVEEMLPTYEALNESVEELISEELEKIGVEE